MNMTSDREYEAQIEKLEAMLGEAGDWIAELAHIPEHPGLVEFMDRLSPYSKETTK